jgi:beta-lactamase class A
MLVRKGIENVRFGPGERLMQSGIAGMAWQQSYAIGNGFEAARARLPAARRLASLEEYASDPVDGAAPAAITETLVRLKRGDLLSPTSTRTLLGIMSQTKTGRARLKAGLAPGWHLAHKTGTGPQFGSIQAGFNDVGILTAPNGHEFAVAIMVADGSKPMAEKQKVIADVGRSVIAYWNTKYAREFGSANSYASTRALEVPRTRASTPRSTESSDQDDQ